MSELFDEVDEEVRREQLKKLWDRYSILIIAVAVLIVGITHDVGLGQAMRLVGSTGRLTAVDLKFDPQRMDATVKLQEPANGPLETMLTPSGRSVISQDSPMRTFGGIGL